MTAYQYSPDGIIEAQSWFVANGETPPAEAMTDHEWVRIVCRVLDKNEEVTVLSGEECLKEAIEKREYQQGRIERLAAQGVSLVFHCSCSNCVPKS